MMVINFWFVGKAILLDRLIHVSFSWRIVSDGFSLVGHLIHLIHYLLDSVIYINNTNDRGMCVK